MPPNRARGRRGRAESVARPDASPTDRSDRPASGHKDSRVSAPHPRSWKLRDSNVTTAGPRSERPAARDWAQIKRRDTLTALISYNSTTYFIYKGEPMGYEYELLKENSGSGTGGAG